MKTAILAIILFCLMIYPHELGHYIAAKLCGVQVNEFAFGMGPVIWKKQKGETLHSIRAFPVGGFCAMEGENGQEDSGDVGYNPRAFNNKKPWQKLIVLFSGAAMNVLTAIIVMTLILCISGFSTTTVKTVQTGEPAQVAGIQEGDEILSVDGMDIVTWNDVSKALNNSDGNNIAIKVLRDGEELIINVTPVKSDVYDENGELQGYRYVIGVSCRVSHNIFRAIGGGVKSTGNLFTTIFESLAMLFKGEVGVDELSGPVGMVQMVSQTAQYGLWYYGFLVALICVNLAVVNLLPLPALDGGRIIFVIYSWITKKQVSQKVEGIVHFIGLGLLLALMIFVTGNDLLKLFKH